MVLILDSTLREGEQTPGIYFCPESKLAIARMLDCIGVDIIEAGNPMIDEEIAESITRIAAAGLKARVGAHSRCKFEDVKRALDCGVSFLGIFLSVSEERLKNDYKTNLDEAMKRIAELISYAKGRDPDLWIRYTAEDAVRSSFDNVLKAATAAAKAGANIISVADTTGYSTPFDETRTISGYVNSLREGLARHGLYPKIAVHCHNDRGLALANALDAFRGKADIIDATVLRLGERTGIVDLAELLLNLRETFGEGAHWRFELLNDLYQLVSGRCSMAIPVNHPLTGKNAFTHTAGVHIKASGKDSRLYQSVDPAMFGREWDFALGVQSGRAAVELALMRMGREDLIGNENVTRDVLREIKMTAKRGSAVNLEKEYPQIVSDCEAKTALNLVESHRALVPVPVNFIEFPKEETEQSIPDRFEARVRAFPDHLAVKTKNRQLTYTEVNNMANRIGRYILQDRGAAPEPVALLLDHDALIIATILGVLKSGKFYVPLDPSYPHARLKLIIEDSGAALLIADSRTLPLANKLATPECNVMNLDEKDVSGEFEEDLQLPISPGAFAYVLYTSGSTGEPKGVIQTHRNVLHNVMKYTNGIHLSSEDRCSLLAYCSFSASISDIFGALLNGASLFLFPLKEESLVRLADWLDHQQITVYHSVPTVFRHFLRAIAEDRKFPQIRLIKLGGEPAYKSDVDLFRRHFSEQCILHVGLGATEMNIIRQYFIDGKTELQGTAVPVGYAVDSTEVLLLDEQMQEVGLHQVGEIAIRSPYLSPGYWRKPELTKALFREDAESGQRIFLTRDLGRMLPDGSLLHLGRKDFQMVKIRGNRIGVAEIEIALLDIPGVREAVVHAQEDHLGEKYLVAYMVLESGPEISVSEIRGVLRERLPEFMIPSAFVKIEKMPLTPNGKVDRLAFPAPERARSEQDKSFVPPRSPLEEVLALICCQVLDIQRVGANDNFFELGGHSLLATQVLSRIAGLLHIELSLHHIFDAPTISGLAEEILKKTTNPSRMEKTAQLLLEVVKLSDNEVEKELAGKSFKLDLQQKPL